MRAFENRLLRIIFWPKRDEVTWDWRKLHNETLNDLYTLSSTIRLIKSRRMKWAGYVECMGRAEVHKGFWWGNLMKRDHLENPRIRPGLNPRTWVPKASTLPLDHRSRQVSK